MRCSLVNRPSLSEQGIVLPMALIMLVIISFAGLLAARNSASFEQFSNNLRTAQVARVSAEDALRRCERFAIDSAENSGATYPTAVARIVTTPEISADDETTMKTGVWNTKSNWVSTSPILITVAPEHGTTVHADAKLKNNPTCIIQALVNDRFLITTRGLSSDAQLATDGTLTSGSEVWLQSILTPSIPTLSSPSGGDAPGVE